MSSLLVSASPIISCTDILLGVLLNFDRPNIPEHDSAFGKCGVKNFGATETAWEGWKLLGGETDKESGKTVGRKVSWWIEFW